MSYHPKKLCSVCGVRCSEVEYNGLLENFFCWECRYQVQAANLRFALGGRVGDSRRGTPKSGPVLPGAAQGELFE